MDPTVAVPVYALSCAWCARVFFVCTHDYRGQGYCRDACRARGCAATHRSASARYQRSLGEEGRRDRRAHHRARVEQRKLAQTLALPDEASQEVARRLECALATSEDVAAVEAPPDAVAGRSCDGRVQGGAVPDDEVDPRARGRSAPTSCSGRSCRRRRTRGTSGPSRCSSRRWRCGWT